ncbi:S26 family signal peptidase [Cupriavidus basilensis]|uniref:Conjugative signal peptidase TrhF n=1 Tax=Cupriavidus basilensis TaxID=68895 RepID=A0A0C4Y9T1_9BURK|nr:S26 family signal peptidase [Cupriavidus basilensis]AJG22232.1 Conjugative signal peptidase TrhF [Cupriavidus basilensis]
MTSRIAKIPRRGHALAPMMAEHFGRWWWAWALILIAGVQVGSRWALHANLSHSIEEVNVFLVSKTDRQIARDSLVEFLWPGGGPYPAGARFIKQIKGMPGDMVTSQGRDYFINGVYVGTAKSSSARGEVLEMGPTGRIPAGRFFVWTPHPDSLDSRYALTGWVNFGQIVGTARKLF